jgi:hypothetical protein
MSKYGFNILYNSKLHASNRSIINLTGVLYNFVTFNKPISYLVIPWVILPVYCLDKAVHFLWNEKFWILITLYGDVLLQI